MSARWMCACAAALALSSAALAGPDWVEIGDAGSIVDTAQAVLGESPTLRSIRGSLSFGSGLADGAADYEDMYLIRITQPSMFSFSATGSTFNPQCFLFNITLPGEAFGLLGNDDTATSNQPRLISPATDGTGASVVLPGVYALGISGFGRDPVSSGGRIFNFASPTEVSGPDGPGGINPHSGWIGQGEVGTYDLDIQGVTFFDVPAPGSAVVFAAAAGALSRRRRR